jgi:hypothetical protein
VATEAKVVITGQNRVGAAVKQAASDLNQLGRQAQSLQKLFQSAFALSGIFAFGKAVSASIEATKKFDGTFARRIDDVHASFSNLLAVKGGLPDVNRQLDELARTLQDPSVIAGADSFFSLLVRGAAAAAKGIAEIAGGIRSIGVKAGIFDPKTQQEKIDALDKEIEAARKVRALAASYGQTANVAKIDADIERLLKQQQAVQDAGPTQYDKPPNLDPFRSSEFTNRGKPFLKSVNPQVLNELDKGGQYLQDEQRRQNAIDDLEEINLNAIEAKKEVEKTFTSMSVFAEQAARNIENAFEDFFFDPFKNGLKGLGLGLIDAFRHALASSAARQLLEYFASFGKGGENAGKAGIVGSFLGAVFGGYKAQGGPLQPGKWYIAGEHGEEPIWGGGSGAFAMGYAGAGGTSVTQVNNIDARGATTDLIQQLPAVLQANNAALKADIIDTFNRRPPPSRR